MIFWPLNIYSQKDECKTRSVGSSFRPIDICFQSACVKPNAQSYICSPRKNSQGKHIPGDEFSFYPDARTQQGSIE